ncbi:DNA mismatch repair endonuclease MutL [bacterium]|jgi:DNA mismatch repair protein MutL|nr:DNA mismatch repair endonuclease MutL [bacterium]
MGKIRILSDSVINKIAAGEVVERPASVLKELIENAIDAGSKRIEAEITAGGKSSILIKDDGEGMDRDDLILAVERHATSKIKDFADIDRLKSLGFRGEALSSISAVSKTEIISMRRGKSEGDRMFVDGGKIKFVEKTGASRGTTVRIRDLFFNVPARKKFLKSTATEEYWCDRIMAEYALSRRDVFFKYTKDGKPAFVFSEKDSLEHIASRLISGEFAKEYAAIDFSAGSISVKGMAGRPSLNRSDRSQQFFFVNGRPVKSNVLSYALAESYRNSMGKDRYPVCLLMIELEPSAFDVNVHPSKREIKFKDEKSIRSLVSEAVSVVFEDKIREGIPSYQKRRPSSEAADIPHVKEKQEEFAVSSAREMPGYRLIGQFDNTYIIIEENSELFLIDQHAAQERINYEKLLGSLEGDKPSVQFLLSPVILELQKAQFEKISEIKGELTSMGFEIEPFGQEAYRIEGMPSFLPAFDIEIVFKDLADMMVREKYRDMKERTEKMAKMFACRRSVKAGDKLDALGMKSILDGLSKTEYPDTCPHGRPVKVRIEKDMIQKWFKRDYKD